MELEGNLCLHIHLINQSECSLYMCIYIYFYLLKCFRLLVREKAYLTEQKDSNGTGLDNSTAQLCHQKYSLFLSSVLSWACWLYTHAVFFRVAR